MADGFHRLLAHEAAGLVDILADVRPGTRRDALLFAVGANASHGLPRTNKDKRRAVEILLRDEEWVGKSDRQVAEKAAVSNRFVGEVRRDMVTVNGSQSTERTGKDGRTINTANIGKAKPADAPTPPSTPPAPEQHPLTEAIRTAPDAGALDAALTAAVRVPGPGGLRPQRQPAPPAPHRRRPRPLRRQDEGALPGEDGRPPC